MILNWGFVYSTQLQEHVPELQSFVGSSHQQAESCAASKLQARAAPPAAALHASVPHAAATHAAAPDASATTTVAAITSAPAPLLFPTVAKGVLDSLDRRACLGTGRGEGAASPALHISVSRTVAIRYPQIDPLTSRLRQAIKQLGRYVRQVQASEWWLGFPSMHLSPHKYPCIDSWTSGVLHNARFGLSNWVLPEGVMMMKIID